MTAAWSARGLAGLSFGAGISSGTGGAGRKLPGRAPVLPVLKGQEGSRGKALAVELARYFRTGEWRFPDVCRVGSDRTPACRGAARGAGRERPGTMALDLAAGTKFDRAVWRALGRVPAGEVRTYGELARSVGSPRAARAVGNACGRNPVAIIVPCHRAVAAAGIGGFGAGVAVKRRLLALEGVRV